MTATVLDVIWCFDCAIRRDLVASTALSPFAVKLSEQDMLDLASSTHTYRDSLDLIRILPYPLRRSLPAVRHAQHPRMLLMPWHDRRQVRYALARRTVLRLHQCATPSVRNQGTPERHPRPDEKHRTA